MKNVKCIKLFFLVQKRLSISWISCRNAWWKINFCGAIVYLTLGKLSQPYIVLHSILWIFCRLDKVLVSAWWCVVIHVYDCGSKMMKLKSCICSGKPSSHIISVISAYLFLVYIAMMWIGYSKRTRICVELHVCNSTIPHTVAKFIFLIIKNCFKIARHRVRNLFIPWFL